MKKLIFILFVPILLISCLKKEQNTQTTETQPNYTWEDVYTADEIEISEALVSIGKHYDVKIDGQVVATVEGKFITALGDKFTLADTNGNIILTEAQERRIFRLSFDRLAIVKDSKGKLHGFFGEEVINDLFNPFSRFHFYSVDEELGLYKAKLAVVNTGEFEDVLGNVEYKFQKTLISLTDNYTLYIRDNDNIPVEYAIFMVCIQDAISDVHKDD